MHQEKHLTSSEFIKDVVIGISDGLTVPFALAAGLSSAVSSTAIVVTAGAAEIIAGSIAMGLGGYLSGRTEIEHYQSELNRESREWEHSLEKEKEEVREIFAGLGISETTQRLVVEELSRDQNKMVDFMMKYELGLEKPTANRARNSALTIGLAYIAGGVIPLAPYWFANTTSQGLLYSSGITLNSLLIFGYLKSRVTGQPPLMGALKVASIGSIAAAAAFFVAKLF